MKCAPSEMGNLTWHVCAGETCDDIWTWLISGLRHEDVSRLKKVASAPLLVKVTVLEIAWPTTCMPKSMNWLSTSSSWGYMWKTVISTSSEGLAARAHSFTMEKNKDIFMIASHTSGQLMYLSNKSSNNSYIIPTFQRPKVTPNHQFLCKCIVRMKLSVQEGTMWEEAWIWQGCDHLKGKLWVSHSTLLTSHFFIVHLTGTWKGPTAVAKWTSPSRSSLICREETIGAMFSFIRK